MSIDPDDACEGCGLPEEDCICVCEECGLSPDATGRGGPVVSTHPNPERWYRCRCGRVVKSDHEERCFECDSIMRVDPRTSRSTVHIDNLIRRCTTRPGLALTSQRDVGVATSTGAGLRPAKSKNGVPF